MKSVLVACEESQAVCIAFRERGFEAYSCDIQECSGGRPEWHIQGDVLPLLDGDCDFITQDGHTHTRGEVELDNRAPSLYLSHELRDKIAFAANDTAREDKRADRATH